MKTDPKITGWDVALPGADGTFIMLYDPTTQQLKELGRWVNAKSYMNPAALLKGELGIITGPVYRTDEKI